MEKKMSKDFVEAMLDWSKKKDAYINDNMSTGKSAPRKNIFITVPIEFEQEIKDYVKGKRKEADRLFSSSIERSKMELAIKFESFTPPPKSNNY
jgi:hypothetical protein